MQLEIGTMSYTVRRRWDLKIDGEPCDGVTSHRDQVIWIDGEIAEPAELLDVLRHEHLHAVEWRMGGAGVGEEKRAQFVAFVGAAFERDLAAAGGVEAVLALPIHGLRPGAISRPLVAEAISNGDRRVCGSCETEVSAGSIGNGELQEHGQGVYLRERWFTCPACGIVQVWTERCSSRGVPLGGFVEARMLSSNEATAFLATHPAAPSPFVAA